MRILYVNGKNNNGGANIALLNIIKGMMAKGHEVHVVTDKKTGFFLNEVNKIGCNIHLCSCNLNIKVGSNVRNPLTIINYYTYSFLTWYRQKRFINHIIKTVKPDLVHTNIGPLTTAAEICNKLSVPHVWHIREYGKEIGFRMFPSFDHFNKLLKGENNYCIAITNGIFSYYDMRECHDCCIYDGVFPESTLSQLAAVLARRVGPEQQGLPGACSPRE